MGWTQKQMIAELRDQAANNSLDPGYERLAEAVANELLRLAGHVGLLRDALLNHSEPLTGDEHMQFCGEAIDKTTPNSNSPTPHVG